MSKQKIKVVGPSHSISSMFVGNKYIYSDSDPDIIVFTGGADINPKLYGEKALYQTIFSDKRDQQDLEAYEKFKDLKKIGICRGAQFLNVMNGGKLWQHVNNHGGDHHLINLLDTPNYKIGEEIRVTSTHHQMMIPNTKKGEATGIAMNPEKTSGIATLYLSGSTKKEHPKYDTEVVWYEETKSLCYQPHPEFQKGTNGERYFFELVEYFFGD